jgi:hypothetical protein
MGLNFQQSASSSGFTTHPQGAHAARVIRVVDLGTQMVQSMGQTKFQPKVLIAWETAHLIESGEHKGKPSLITARYTASMHEKANLRKMLEDWRGMKMTDDEARKFPMKSIIGKTCMINVVHRTNGDQTYANVTSVFKLPPGMTPPEQVAASYYFDLDHPDEAVFEQLSPKLQEVVMGSPEYERWRKGPQQAEASTADAEEDADIPF